MTYSNRLESPINSLYLFAFISGKTSASEVKYFLEELFFKEIKRSNLSGSISYLVKEGYLLRSKTDDDSGRIIYTADKKKIIEDIFSELLSVTLGFTYTFRLEGRSVTKQKDFSYNDNCTKLKEDMLLEGVSSDSLFSLFSDFCRDVILFYSQRDSIRRTDKEFSYFSIIRNFLLGFSVDDSFAEDYNSYLSSKQFVGVEGKGLKLGESLRRFRELTRIYSSLLNMTDLSMMARNRIELDLER